VEAGQLQQKCGVGLAVLKLLHTQGAWWWCRGKGRENRGTHVQTGETVYAGSLTLLSR
jgi:hypothetical protein